MRLEKIFVRHYPPGLRLRYRTSAGETKHSTIDLLSLGPETNLRLLVNQLIEKEPLLTKSHSGLLTTILHALIDKQCSLNADDGDFALDKTLRPHAQPMTNFAISKNAHMLVTSSYDKTARLFRRSAKCRADEKVVLTGHDGVVYCVALNHPYSNLVLTGAFDKTCRLWDTATGKSLRTFSGHEGEVVAVAFNSRGTHFGSCSMDCTATLWDTEAGTSVFDLVGHTAEVATFAFDTTSSLMATGSAHHCLRGTNARVGSCDASVRLWDARYGACFRSFDAHLADIATVSFNHQSNLLLSASADGSARVWDVHNGKPLFTFQDHIGEVTDACFNATGSLLATSGQDGSIYVYDTLHGHKRCICRGHKGEVTKITFNRQGSRIVSAGADKTVRVWDTHSGNCVQVLDGHDDHAFGCQVSYDGKTIVTGSHDNTVRFWVTSDGNEKQ
ncbi:WD domain-containing protein [Achlya hypogyna]|uniref:WD domain-containing protein n=1 Tax=Achlya hypogyna TaxID=1202772 RepID=A0A1V9YIQ5_ACHHY|nr:WD domain-containing protein [Achlya hypogyna]